MPKPIDYSSTKVLLMEQTKDTLDQLDLPDLAFFVGMLASSINLYRNVDFLYTLSNETHALVNVTLSGFLSMAVQTYFSTQIP